MAEWTPRQTEAITSRNPHILISAAAGSGKTSVLIERVMDMLRGGASLERMLVVTFTHAAAAEMKGRLGAALEEEALHDRHLRAQQALLNRADIGTLHSICKKIIQRNFQAADADPMARVGDEGRLKALLDRAVSDEMEKLYKSPDEDGQCLIDQYDGSQIEEMLRQLHIFLMSQDRPWDWTREMLTLPDETSLPEHPWYRYALTAALQETRAALSLIDDNLRLCRLPNGPGRYTLNAGSDRELALSILAGLEERGIADEGVAPQFVRLSTAKAPAQEDPGLRELFKEQREEAKALIKSALERLPRGQAGLQKAAEDLAYTWPALRALCRLTRRCHERYGELKGERQLLDYNDLEHLALACLEDGETRREVSSGYDALFVDEYQDISRIQEAIIQGLRGDNATLFMVGDVKQSIYRFRLADPGLFLEKYVSFSSRADAHRRIIHLNQNFRSRENVLACVNHVFKTIMLGGALEIDYDSDAALYPGIRSENDPPAELHLLLPGGSGPDEGEEEDEGEQPGGVQREALVIAQRIKALLGSPVREGSKTRPMSYRDMVILLRSASGRAGDIAGVLKDSGIPVYCDADQQYFDLQEVSDALALLHVIDNPLQDINLMTALRSPAFGFSADELAMLRQKARDSSTPIYESFFALEGAEPRVTEAAARLRRWRFLCANTGLDAFLRRLLRETGLYAQAGAKPQGALRRANLRLLCERAAPNPQPQTLQGFLGRVKEARRQETTRAASPLGAGEDVVRIMTIHKSKGLEFPLVFLPDLVRRFRMDSQSDLLLLDAASGMALRKVDPVLRMSHATFGGKAIQMKKNRETRSEEARLLYVAMTRAKERLILLAAPSNIKSARKAWAKPQDAHRAGSAGSMMDWLGGSLWPAIKQEEDTFWTAPGGSVWQVTLRNADSLRLARREGDRPPAGLSEERPSAGMCEQMAGLRLGPAYPLKLSVTQLTQKLPDAGEETPSTKRLPLGDLPLQAPAARGDGQGISRGAATHRALSLVELKALRGLEGQALMQALDREMLRLESAGVLRADERRAAETRRMADFFESPLGKRLLSAPDAQREWPFSLMAEHEVLLQGVLDCCFMEDGGWVLIDYKTDRAAPEGILSRYRDQMRWYMRALRDITGLPVREAFLYALYHGRALAVAEEEAIRFEGAAAPEREAPHGG